MYKSDSRPPEIIIIISNKVHRKSEAVLFHLLYVSFSYWLSSQKPFVKVQCLSWFIFWNSMPRSLHQK